MSRQHVEEHSPPLHVARRYAVLVVAVAAAVGLIAASVAAMRTEGDFGGAPAANGASAPAFSLEGVAHPDLRPLAVGARPPVAAPPAEQPARDARRG